MSEFGIVTVWVITDLINSHQVIQFSRLLTAQLADIVESFFKTFYLLVILSSLFFILLTLAAEFGISAQSDSEFFLNTLNVLRSFPVLRFELNSSFFNKADDRHLLLYLLPHASQNLQDLVPFSLDTIDFLAKLH